DPARRPAGSGAIRAVAFAPDGRSLVTAERKEVTVWDTRLRQKQAAFPVPAAAGNTRSVAYPPDGKAVALGAWDGSISVYHAAALRAHTDIVAGLAFAPDGQTLLSGGYDKLVVVWDVAGRRERLRFRAHTSRVLGLALSPDARTLATAGEGDLKLWHAATWQE